MVRGLTSLLNSTSKTCLWFRSRSDFFAGVLDAEHPSRLRDSTLAKYLIKASNSNECDVVKLPEGFGFEYEPVLAVLRYIYTGLIEFVSKVPLSSSSSSSSSRSYLMVFVGTFTKGKFSRVKISAR